MKKTKTDLQIKKDKIRKEILAKRNILSDKDINKKSDLIIKNLTSYIENVQNIIKMNLFYTNLDIMNLLPTTFMMKKYWMLSSFLLLPLILRKIGLGLVEDIMTLFWKKSERKIIKFCLLEFVMIFR